MKSDSVPPLADSRDLLERAYRRLRELRNEQDREHRRAREPIAVVGLGCRFPGGADNPESLSKILKEGREVVAHAAGDIPSRAATLEESGYPQGGFLADVRSFDPEFFGIAPRDAALIDPQQRLLLEVCWEALEQALIPAEEIDGGPAGLFCGTSFDDFASLTLRSGDPRGLTGPAALGASRSIGPARVAYHLGLTGPVLQLDTSCSSSLLAVHLACRSLRNDECELALAGGVNLILGPETTRALQAMGALAPDGRSKAFDDDADGYVRGEGCGIVVLERLSRALERGRRIWAVLPGSAINHDGRSNGLTAPNGQAQQRVLAAALAEAGLGPEVIDYIEAHGTGTNLGDPIEAAALTRVFGPDRERPLYLGSAKSNFGHLESAAGILGLIKAVLAVHSGEIPPTLHVRRPTRRIDWQRTPLRLATESTPWPEADRPRRAGVSSFGMSGTNVHVLVEQPPAPQPALERNGGAPALLAISAKTPAALREMALRYADRVDGLTAVALEDVCYSAGVGRTRFVERLAVGGDARRIAEQLRKFASGEGAGEDSLPRSLEQARERFLAGEAVDWRGLYPEARLADLPPYPYERKVCWPDLRRLSAGERRAEPLLGRRLATAAVVYEAEWRAETTPALGAHTVSGRRIAPASAIVAAVVAAAADSGLEGRLELRDVRFESPVELDGEGATIQLGLTRESEGGYRFELHQATADGWRLCARGFAASRVDPDPSDEPAAEPTGTWRSAEGLYAAFAECGVDYGAALQGLERVCVDGERAWGETRAGVDFAAAIDAAIQVSAAPLAAQAETRALAGFARLRLQRLPARETLRVEAGRDGAVARDRAGHGLFHFDGLRFAAPPANILQELAWRPRAETLEPPALPRAEELSQALAAAPQPELERYEQALWELEALAASFARQAVLTAPAPGRNELSERLREIAAQADAEPAAARAARLERDFPDARAEIALTARCGKALSEVVAGRCDPLALLFPEGDSSEATRIYRDSPGGRAMNGLLAEALRRIAREAGGALRVLEVGGGTGGSTAAALEALPAGAKYCFTDISPHFVEQARSRFGSRPGFSAQVFDVERSPAEQGLGPGAFDVVFAANVLHATADLRATLANVRRVLAPGGWLLLVEGVEPSNWLDVTFGLTDGWRRFRDRELRGAHPLASVEVWRSALLAEGFEAPVASRPGRPGGPLRQALLAARAHSHRRLWLLDGDGAEALEAAGDAVTADVAADVDGVVFAGAEAGASVADAERLCEALLRLAQARLGRLQPAGFWVVVGDAASPASRAVRALARTLAAEHPELDCRVIESRNPQAWVSVVRGGRLEAGAEIALREGIAWEPQLCVYAPAPRQWSWGPGPYLITGGTGGMGLRLAERLARRGVRRIALLARRAPSADAAEAIEALRRAGAEVRIVAADVADESVLEATLASIRAEWGGLRGVVHAAGVYSDRLLADQEWSRFEEVFRPKVRGGWNLHRLTASDPLDCFVLCSSAAAINGAAGLANYAAANGFLDGLARLRARDSRPALSVQWGPIEGVGMAAAVGEARRSQWSAAGMAELAVDEAFDGLERLLAGGAVEAALFRPARAASTRTEELGRESFQARLARAPAGERPVLVRDEVREIVARALGYQPPEALPTRDGLFELGMDSLVSLEILKTLGRTFRRQLPQTLLFAHPSVEALATFLAAHAAAEPVVAPRAAPQPPAQLDEGGADELRRETERLEALLEELNA